MSENRQAVVAPVEASVRPLVERLREAAQGEELFGFDGLRDEPDALLTEAADEIECLRADSERLEFLMRTVSGAEFRRIGIVYGAGCTREAIDTYRTPSKA